MKFDRFYLAALAATLMLFLSSMFFAPRISQAMPEFAQASGLQCSACHTMVPLLNAYGRYVARSKYQAISRESLDKTFPLWISEQINYNSTAGKDTGVNRFDSANLAVHAIGYAAPDVTYHIQQWIVQNNASGGVDTAWVSYNHVLSPDVHFEFGKILNPAPSLYAYNSDVDNPLASQTVVGEHPWSSTYNNRWGSELSYSGSHFAVSAAYLWAGGDLGGATNFAPGIGVDKTFQWKVAYAQVKSPVEIGVFGSNGNLGVTNANDPTTNLTDIYSSQAGYVQVDPGKHFRPGGVVIYQRQSDSNPGTNPNSGLQYGPASTWGLSYEINELLLNGNALISYRHDQNQMGITGGYISGNSVNLAFNIPIYKFPYLHGYFETQLGGNSSLFGASGGPQWKGYIWLTVPLVLHPS